MAEKDAYYYYEQAKNARENGNERLAQIMENYARQIDPVYQDRAMRGGFADPQEPAPAWTPNRNTNAPTRAEYEARQQQPTLQQRYNQYADIQNAQSAKQGYVDQSDWEDPAVYQDMQNSYVAPSNASVADFRRSEDNYAPPQQVAEASSQNGNYDSYWNGDTIANWFKLDDSSGRKLREDYVTRQQNQPAPRRKGSEGDKPTWPSYKDIFPDW